MEEHMYIAHATLDNCSQAQGVAVVIDVIRAFTTAAIAFERGACEIIPVGTLEQARALRSTRWPDALLMGEEGGWRPEGFDFGNSPAALAAQNLGGRRLVQRTGAGTQGLVRCAQATTLLAASFLNASATARYLHKLNPPAVTLVSTGIFLDRDGDEDLACADYMHALLLGERPDPAAFAARVLKSDAAELFSDPNHPAFPSADLDFCTAVDRVDFVMLVERQDDLLYMRPHTVVLP